MLLLHGVACHPGDRPGGVRVAQSDSSGVALVRISGSVEELPLLTLPPSPLVEVSGDAPPYLSSVGEIEILSDGGLLIEDNQTDELRRFDSAGREVRILGGRGDGPGEFQNLTELSLTAGDTAYAYDRRLYRISRFDPDGSLAATVPVGRERAGSGSLVLDGWATDSDHLLLHSMGPGDNAFEGPAFRDQRDAVLHLLDAEGNEIGSAVHFTGDYSIRGSHGDAGSPFANRPFVSVAGGRVLYGSSLTYELILTDAGLQPTRIIRWDGWRKPLTSDVLATVRETLEAGFARLREEQPDVVTTLLDALFDPDLLPDTLPAVGSAQLDERGRVWVTGFRPGGGPRVDEGAIWHVLDPEGAPMVRVQLPPRARLAAIRGERIAVVHRDELDVEHVRVYELRIPAGG